MYLIRFNFNKILVEVKLLGKLLIGVGMIPFLVKICVDELTFVYVVSDINPDLTSLVIFPQVIFIPDPNVPFLSTREGLNGNQINLQFLLSHYAEFNLHKMLT